MRSSLPYRSTHMLCYAATRTSGTDLGYAATLNVTLTLLQGQYKFKCAAMRTSGSDLCYAATRKSGTDLSYAATRSDLRTPTP